MVLSKSGTVKNYLFCGILSDNLVENWVYYFLMYRRNVPLRHLTMIIIVSAVTAVRYVEIAAP